MTDSPIFSYCASPECLAAWAECADPKRCGYTDFRLGRSFFVGLNVVLDDDDPTYSAIFMSIGMKGTCMVGLCGATIAPSSRVIVLPKGNGWRIQLLRAVHRLLMPPKTVSGKIEIRDNKVNR